MLYLWVKGTKFWWKAHKKYRLAWRGNIPISSYGSAKRSGSKKGEKQARRLLASRRGTFALILS